MKRVVALMMAGTLGMMADAQVQTVTLSGPGSCGTAAGQGSCKVLMSVNGGELRDITGDSNVKIATPTTDQGARKPATRLGLATIAASDEVRAQLDLPAGVGVTVHGVTAGSPAAKAGIKINDILTQLDGQMLMDARQLRNLVIARKAGDAVKLTYLRKGKPATVSAVLDAQEQAATPEEVIDLGSFNIDLGELMGKMPEIGKGGAVKVITFGPNGIATNAKDSEVGAKLMEVLSQALGGSGSNSSVTVKSVVVGKDGMTGADAAKITDEVSKALKAAGVADEQVSKEIQRKLEEALKEKKGNKADH